MFSCTSYTGIHNELEGNLFGVIYSLTQVPSPKYTDTQLSTITHWFIICNQLYKLYMHLVHRTINFATWSVVQGCPQQNLQGRMYLIFIEHMVASCLSKASYDFVALMSDMIGMHNYEP